MTKANFKNKELKKFLMELCEDSPEFQKVLNEMLKAGAPEEFLELQWRSFSNYWKSWKLFQKSKNEKDCQQKIPGYRFVFNFSTEQKILYLQIDKCHHKPEMKTALKRNYLIHDFDYRLKNKSLKNTLKPYLNNSVISDYLIWFRELRNLNHLNKPWAFVSGDSQTGKTLFTVLGANEFIFNQNETVIFIDANNLFVKFNHVKFTDKLNAPAFYKKFKTIPLLIIDNLGSETLNVSFRDEFLSNVLNYRKINFLPTIFISNFDFENFQKRYVYSKSQVERITSQNFFNKWNGITKFFTFQKKIKNFEILNSEKDL